jgi:hypothetical protein
MAYHGAELWQTVGHFSPAARSIQTPGLQQACQTGSFSSNIDPPSDYLPIQELNSPTALNPVYQFDSSSDWHCPDYRPQSNSTRCQRRHQVPAPSHGRSAALEIGKLQHSRYSATDAENPFVNFSTVQALPGDCIPLQLTGVLQQQSWVSSAAMASRQAEFQHAEAAASFSPQSHLSVPSPLGDDSTYGSGSSQADSMTHATNYFPGSDMENRMEDKGRSPRFTSIKQENLSEMASVPNSTAHADQTRHRQDAHSKVEKRYRMNINSKIEQLRRILPITCPPGDQSSSLIVAPHGSRRRKSGTDLSKQDVLSMTINYVERLQSEIQDVTSQNLELKGRIASMRS